MYWVNHELCTGCLACAEACTTPGALVIREGKPVVDTVLCTACAACVDACPRGAISEVEPAREVVTVQSTPQGEMAATRRSTASWALEKTKNVAELGLPRLAALFGARRGIGASPGRFGAGQCRRNRRGGGQRGRPARNW